MDPSRVLDVLVVCLPVFAVMGLGKVLAVKGQLGRDRRTFINWLVYYFALPSLIFHAVAQQRFSSFMEPGVTLVPVAALIVLGLITILVGRLLGYKGAFAAAFVFGTFWSNVSYMGFPLCTNAFGDEGLGKAAVYNAFVMPFFIIFGYSLIGAYGAGKAGRLRDKIKQVALNPIVLAALVGIGVALLGECFRDEAGALELPFVWMGLIRLLGSSLKLIGGMGLPMALLAIGGSLHWSQTRSHLGALAYVLVAKLILFPLLVLVGIRLFLPDCDPVVTGVAVMLSGTPNAVASYVVSCQVGVEEGFVSSMLVVSTVLSIVTLPAWLYFVM